MSDIDMKTHPLGIAARYNDAECEEHDFFGVIDKIGLDVPSLMHIAEQRALRVLWIALGRDMGVFRGTEPTPMALTGPERLQLIHFQAAVLDGICIGWRAAQMKDANDA